MSYSSTGDAMKKSRLTILILILTIYLNSFQPALSIQIQLNSIDARPGIYTLYEDEAASVKINVTYNSLPNYTEEPAVNVTVEVNGMILWSVFSLQNRKILFGELSEWNYYPLWIPKGLNRGDEIELYNSKFKVIAASENEVLVTNGSLTLKFDAFTGVMITGDLIIKGESYHVYIKATNMKLRRTDFEKLYYDWKALTKHLEKLNETYRNHLKIYSIGNSCLGRRIWVCEVPARKVEEAAIVIDGGMHGSEVIGVKAAVYILDKILENYYAIEELDRFTIIVIPMLNPDGVEASKYLPPQPQLMLKYARCNARGVDLNRNFAYAWEKGGSDQFESPVFRGLNPESEPEVKALLSIFKNRNVIFYVNLHSGVSATLIPGYNSNPYVTLYESEIAAGISNIFGHQIYKGKIYGGAANWALFASDKKALSIIIELYGDKAQLETDWFYFYNPDNNRTVEEICGKAYYSILFILKNAEKWIEKAEEIKLRREFQSRITYFAVTALVIMLAAITFMKVKKVKLQPIRH
ncbi:MAG: M14 family metallopeptidase [archaeon GB-1867-005]|nr:M14 family metallopeptidase [Candidatus Culexmicrobium cathedralense]